MSAGIDFYGEITSRVMDYEESGDSYVMIPCPFHDDDDPSCSVSTRDGSFRCFSGVCRARGDFYELISELDGITYSEARKIFYYQPVSAVVENIRRQYERDSEHDAVQRYYDLDSFKSVFPSALRSEKAMEYLRSRGITEPSVDRFLIRWGGNSKKFKGRVILPIFNESGKLVSYVGRTVYSNSRGPKTKKSRSPGTTFYGLYELLRDRGDGGKLPRLIVVEGEFDAIYLQQFGLPAVAVMGTTRMGQAHGLLLRKYAKLVVLSYDGDDAGEDAMERDMNVIHGYVPTTLRHLPEGKDPNDLETEEVEDVYEVKV